MDLTLYRPDDADLSTLLEAAADARALEGIVKDAKTHVDGQLRAKVERLSDATGTAFTGRHDGYAVALTDPQPQPKIADHSTFAEWAATRLPEAQQHDTPAIVDPSVVLAFVQHFDELQTSAALQAAEDLVDQGLEVRTEWLLPEDPFKLLVDRGHVKVTEDGVIDLDTGELVPGAAVSRAKPQLRVTGDKRAKDARRRDVEQRLGIAPELEEGVK